LFLEESDRYHEGANLPTLPVLKVGGNPRVDGQLDDPCWRDAEAMPFKNALDSKNPTPRHGATVQAVWTDTGVTFGFRLVEPEIGKLSTKRTVHDQDVYGDDCIEIFLDVEAQRENYYQVVANAIGAIYDGSRVHKDWSAPGARAAGFTGQDYWTLEVYIPYADFKEPIAVKTGSAWFGNFMRTRTVTGKNELQRWSTLFRGSNHDFSAFGLLKFVE
jgi:hypothetical protein